MSLDAYYDSEYAGESSEAVRTNKENGQVEVKPAVNDTGKTIGAFQILLNCNSKSNFTAFKLVLKLCFFRT